MGVVSVFLTFPIACYLLVAGWESLPRNESGWLLVVSASLLGLCFNWLLNLGVSLTFPLFVTIGYSLHVPANAIVDRIIRQVKSENMLFCIYAYMIYSGSPYFATFHFQIFGRIMRHPLYYRLFSFGFK